MQHIPEILTLIEEINDKRGQLKILTDGLKDRKHALEEAMIAQKLTTVKHGDIVFTLENVEKCVPCDKGTKVAQIKSTLASCGVELDEEMCSKLLRFEPTRQPGYRIRIKK